MWMFVVAVLLRFLFVSLIARYQLCNQHGEGVLDGLARLHPLYPPLIFAAVVVMGHIYGAYMSVGIGEIGRQVAGAGEPWLWAVLFNGIAVALVFRPSYRRLEAVFLVFLAVLSVSFLGSALWVGFDAGELAARPGPHRNAGAARDLRSLARRAGDGRRGRRVADEPGVSVLPGGERLARAALPARAALRSAARHPRHAGAQPGGVDSRCRAAVPGPAHRKARGPAEPADRRPRARRGPALLRRALRRGLHVARRTRRRSRLPGQPRLAALAGRPRRADPGAAGPPRSTGGSRCGAWSRRCPGRCQGCRDSSG